MRKFIVCVIESLGYHVIPKWRLPTLDFANHLSDVFSRFDISCVLDVGANRGQYARFLRHGVGFRGKIISFEPIEDCCKELRQHAAKDGNWIVVNCALGAEEETRAFNVMVGDSLSSFLLPNNETQKFPYAYRNQIVKKVPVQVRRLDGLVAQLGITGPIYLKMDTQGFDLEVVKGADMAMTLVSALQSEVSIHPIYHEMPNWCSAIETFNRLGFEVSGLWPVSRGPDLEVIEFDCVMVRTSPGPL